MRKRIYLSILLAGSMFSMTGISSLPVQATRLAQNQNNNDLFYLYKGQRIPLSQRQDAIAVAFKKVAATRSRTSQPLYLQLQQALQGGVRGPGAKVEVSPLGEKYALVTLPSAVRGTSGAVQQRIQQQPYVQSTLPVLSRSDRTETIVLPNEIIISFDSQLSDSQKQAILQQKNLEIVRQLRFNTNRYLVKSTDASGTKVLNIANQLNEIKGVSSAAPNFIQSLSERNQEQVVKLAASLTNQKSFYNVTNEKTEVSSTRAISPKTDLLGLAWHLSSVPLKQCLRQQISNWNSLQTCLQQKTVAKKSAIPRTDMRITDAWKRSNGGRGVVVAVIDSLIQWDHPDLAGSLYTVRASDRCPGEVHGWDFSADTSSNSTNPCDIGDPDTRIAPSELAILRTKFQHTFQLSDAQLLQQYLLEAYQVKQAHPEYSVEEVASVVRYMLRTYEVGSEFHGTWVSGVIAAKPQNGQGLVGVAPNAQILPVRVMGLNGSFVPSAYIEAIGYAAARGADVINISLGARLPIQAEEEQITEVLQANPKLVIVAAAGNDNSRLISFPAAHPGVVSVGATNLLGHRASYSNYGKGLAVVAPGGELDSPGLLGGIPTTGGTWLDAFWQGIPNPTSAWSSVLDPKGKYWWVQGTSFSSPAVAGVVALMKGEDPKRRLSRKHLVNILQSTASYQGLIISDKDAQLYRLQRNKGLVPSSVTDKQYFFGKGLVNADAAVKVVRRGR